MKTESDLLRRIELRYEHVKAKLAAHTITESGCWEYQGNIRADGYGRMHIYANGLRPQKRQFVASRVAYAFFNGVDPAEKFVCHHCDNPACINPDHLFLGTHQDNMRDMDQKGRRAAQDGVNNGNARLDEEAARRAIERIELGHTNKAIAKDLGVTHSMISSIRRGLSWTDVANDMGYEPQPCFKRKSA